MSELVVSDAVTAELTRTIGPVALRDRGGRVLGKYVPEPIVPWDPSLTEEELDRRELDPGGKSLSEILERLGAK